QRSRLLLARILKQSGNFLILDEPTNDLDLPTLRVLEEALIAFPGVVLVVSHDRYFLNRVSTDILAFEGDQRITHTSGNYDYYLEKRDGGASVPASRTTTAGAIQKAAGAGDKTSGARFRRASASGTAATAGAGPTTGGASVPASRPRKLTWKETKELETMETRILEIESEIARIESLFSSPDFHRTHATQT